MTDAREGDQTRAPGGRHIPVLLPEVMTGLAPQDGETFIDATFGAGGYARAILDAANCNVIAFDRDPSSIRGGAALKEQYARRLRLVLAPFSRMDEFVTPPVDGVVFDIGVSSLQLDDAARGFSFQQDGPLDMRMSAAPDQTGALAAAETRLTAAEVVNTFDDKALADLIFEFGEERRSRAIAKAIVRQRQIAPIERTRQLADVVARVFHGRKVDGRHPATRTFQALRIFVNDELGELRRGLSVAERLLAPEGRLAVVTFHSLEDRIVKRFLAERSGRVTGESRHKPDRSLKMPEPSFRILNTRPLTPSKGELDVNPRARSARLRMALRTHHPPLCPDGVTG